MEGSIIAPRVVLRSITDPCEEHLLEFEGEVNASEAIGKGEIVEIAKSSERKPQTSRAWKIILIYIQNHMLMISKTRTSSLAEGSFILIGVRIHIKKYALL